MSVDIQTGITTNSPVRMMIGAGKVLVNFVDGAGGGSERVLGMTKGGNIYEVNLEMLDPDADGAYGKVQGLEFIVGATARITANLLEVLTTQNLLLTLGGLESADRTWTYASEYLGTGLELDGAITPEGGTDIDMDTVKVKYGAGAGAEQFSTATLGTDYTLNTTTGAITRLGSTIADADEVIVEYMYDSSGSSDDFDVLTIDHLDDDDYRDWALVGRPTSSTLTNPAYFILRNALSAGGLSINLQKKQGAVIALSVEAHWSRTDLSLDNAPFEMWVPQT